MRFAFLCVTLLSLAACGDPLAKLPKLDEVELAQDAGQAEYLPDASEQSLVSAEPVVIADEDKPRRGVLGFLRGRADRATGDNERAGQPAETTQEGFVQGAETQPSEREDVQLAALAPPPSPSPEAEPKRGGLFGALRGGTGRGTDKAASPSKSKGPKPGAPDYEQVGPGVTLPHGKVARLCGVPANRLGSKADSFPKRGGKYTLYDSTPGSTGARSFYLTGFDDGCARQFTAALVLFGSVEIYEQIHYGSPSETQPRSETDRAYEALATRVCRVGRGKPCGPSKISKLARNTAFFSVYERFGDNARWTTLLVHNGEVLAIDTKG